MDRYNCHEHGEMRVIDTSGMKDREVEIIMIYKDLDGGEKKKGRESFLI